MVARIASGCPVRATRVRWNWNITRTVPWGRRQLEPGVEVIEVHILIPIRDNQGQIFAAEYNKEFETILRDEFQGYSQLPGWVAGGWKDGSGNVYSDQTRIYAVDLKSITEGGKVKTVVEFAKNHYRQLAIFIRYLGLCEVL